MLEYQRANAVEGLEPFNLPPPKGFTRGERRAFAELVAAAPPGVLANCYLDADQLQRTAKHLEAWRHIRRQLGAGTALKYARSALWGMRYLCIAPLERRRLLTGTTAKARR